MPARKIQADYEKLTAISALFKRRADGVQNLIEALTKISQTISEGAWVGKGAQTYLKEMNDLVLPGLKRLQGVLTEAISATRKIVQAFQEAEDEAGRLFQGQPETFLANRPLVANLKNDSVFSDVRDTFGSVFTTDVRRSLMDNIPTAVNHINNSAAGAALVNDITNAGMRFTLPDGTSIGDPHAPAHRSWTVTFANVSDAAGQTDNASRTITVSTARLYAPGNAMMLARTIAHEMQHAYDYQAGRMNAPGTGDLLSAGAVNRMQAILQESVNTEIRAHTREYAMRDAVAYSENGIFNHANVKFILNDRGYGKTYEDFYNSQLKAAYNNDHSIGLYKVKVRAGVGGNIQVQLIRLK
ncbi:MAG TPA: WXG100 family type VII secretion target [Aggregatilineales bacterium]|nr:WXG100 family type VII secretion target [Anaerolineales bacterium]HRE47084.1 WXG100 family type VII secretion target [Aggregatilineales bacterium]